MNLEECNTKTQRHEDTKSGDEISHQIIGAAIEVHRTLGGPGLLESLLVNFGVPYVKDGVSRIINGIL